MIATSTSKFSSILSVSSLLFVGNAWGTAQVLRVTNDGADSASCGGAATPCRSISQAIENASAGDLIEVGAGTYGDISGDGTFSHPGDEHPQTLNAEGQGFGRHSGCMICITKPLTIRSLHGAAVTMIADVPSSTYPVAVQIASPGVVFGIAGGGFTVTGGNGVGVLIDQNFMGALQKNIKVQGNVDIGDGTGFSFSGLEFSDRPCPDPSCQATATVYFLNNQAIDNPGAGFSFVDNQYFGRLSFVANVAQGGGTGFLVDTGTQSVNGTAAGTGNVSLTNNVAAHNSGYGFSTVESGSLVGNSALNNAKAGFLVVPGDTFQGNSAIGNGGPGVIVQDSADVFDDGYGSVLNPFRVFSQNNFYGNDRNRPALFILQPNGGIPPGLNPGPGAHCGVLNLGKVAAAPGQPGSADGPPPIVSQPAIKNYWGSAHGPSPTGPGDAAGGPCDQNGGVTVSTPFATAALAITTAP